MGSSKLQNFAGEISDAIPNEVTKLNSYSKYLEYIPYVGQALSAIMKGVSAVDNFGETYSNSGDVGAGISHAMKGIQGQSVDPNAFSEKNQGFGGDPWLIAGDIGNMIPSFGGKSEGGGGGFSGITSAGSGVDVGGTNAFGNVLGSGQGGGFNLGSLMDIGSMFGGSNNNGVEILGSAGSSPVTQNGDFGSTFDIPAEQLLGQGGGSSSGGGFDFGQAFGLLSSILGSSDKSGKSGKSGGGFDLSSILGGSSGGGLGGLLGSSSSGGGQSSGSGSEEGVGVGGGAKTIRPFTAPLSKSPQINLPQMIVANLMQSAGRVSPLQETFNRNTAIRRLS